MSEEHGRPQLERFDIKAAFANREEELAARLDRGAALTDHPTLVGTGTEHGWYGLIRDFLPGRYGLVTGKVVDSRAQQSEQIDLIVHDSFYSPLLFTVGDATFVPAESVYAVLEVRPSLSKANLDAAAQKAESVRRLHRTSVEIPNQLGQPMKKDLSRFPILAGLLGSSSEWKFPFDELLEARLREQSPDRAIDFGCALGAGAFDTRRELLVTDRTLTDVTTSVPDRSLSFFAMRLLYRLQQMGSVGAIDYEAYGERAALDVDDADS